MKNMQNDDFLKPLKNRPGLKPRQEFKKELATKLEDMDKVRSRTRFIKGPVLLGVAIALMFILFSKDIWEQILVENGNRANEPKQENSTLNPSGQDIIMWNGQVYIFSKKIAGDEIGMKLGEITKKVEENKGNLKDGEATLVDAGTMVYSVGNTKDIAVKKDDQWMMYQIYGMGGIYITEEEAIVISKKMSPDKEISWEAHFYTDPAKVHDMLVDAPNPIWKVSGTYPLTNKVHYYIDAKTGDIIFSGESEAEGFVGGNDGFVQIKQVNDQFDKATNYYSGEIIILLSEKAMTEFRKNGASVKVILSVEPDPLTTEPMVIPDPRDEMSIPFEFNLKSAEQKAGSLVLSIFDRNGVVIYEELKGVILE